MDDSLQKLADRLRWDANIPNYERQTAEEIMGQRNFYRGFELAVGVKSREEFAESFDSEIVREYTGSWTPKERALHGARAAVLLGMTVLTDVDINIVLDSYKSKIISTKYKEKYEEFSSEAFLRKLLK